MAIQQQEIYEICYQLVSGKHITFLLVIAEVMAKKTMVQFLQQRKRRYSTTGSGKQVISSTWIRGSSLKTREIGQVKLSYRFQRMPLLFHVAF